jgi:hypothetical protein
MSLQDKVLTNDLSSFLNYLISRNLLINKERVFIFGDLCKFNTIIKWSSIKLEGTTLF